MKTCDPWKPCSTQYPSVLAAQLAWCRMRGKSRARFFRYKRALEGNGRSAVIHDETPEKCRPRHDGRRL